MDTCAGRPGEEKEPDGWEEDCEEGGDEPALLWAETGFEDGGGQVVG